jgi:hypothetical protein
MKHGFLRLGFADDGDGTGELFADAESEGFVGSGSAYFGAGEIEKFASAISEYPLPQRDRCLLTGGFGARTPGPIQNEHLGIEVYPIDSRGHIGVPVRLATPAWGDTRPESQKTLKLELRTTYEPLARFSRDLIALIKGTAEKAILEEDAIP